MKKRWFYGLIVILIFLSITAGTLTNAETVVPVKPQDNTKYPVIILPGILGSILVKAEPDGSMHSVWPPRGYMDPAFIPNIGEDIADLACDNQGNPLYRNVFMAGPIMQLLQPIVDQLIAKGFPVYVFPYDWRLDNDVAARNLAIMIDSLNAAKVNLVGYSLGGIVAAKYIANGNNQKVNKFISIGAPFLGSSKALTIFECGEFGDAGDSLTAGPFLQIACKMPAVYQLLPTRDYITDAHEPVVRLAMMNYGFDLFQYWTYKDFLKKRIWANDYLLEQAEKFQESLGLTDRCKSLSDKVDLYTILGDANVTAGKLTYKYKIGQWISAPVLDDLAPVQGDDTVPVKSGTIAGHTIPERTYYTQMSHSGLILHPGVIEQVVNILQGQPDLLATGIRRNQLRTKSIRIKVDAAVQLNIYDQSNNHIGLNNYGMIDKEIPWSQYFRFPESQVVLINNGIYQVRLDGNHHGECTYNLRIYNENDQLQKEILFEHVRLNPGIKIYTQTDITQKIVLNIDSNGDGQIDYSLNPTRVICGGL